MVLPGMAPRGGRGDRRRYRDAARRVAWSRVLAVGRALRLIEREIDRLLRAQAAAEPPAAHERFRAKGLADCGDGAIVFSFVERQDRGTDRFAQALGGAEEVRRALVLPRRGEHLGERLDAARQEPLLTDLAKPAQALLSELSGNIVLASTAREDREIAQWQGNDPRVAGLPAAIDAFLERGPGFVVAAESEEEHAIAR